MNDTDQNTTSPTGLSPAVRTEAQHARSFALDRASAHTLDLARVLRTACEADMKKPLDQRARAQLRKTAAEKLRQIEAQMGRGLE